MRMVLLALLVLTSFHSPAFAQSLENGGLLDTILSGILDERENGNHLFDLKDDLKLSVNYPSISTPEIGHSTAVKIVMQPGMANIVVLICGVFGMPESSVYRGHVAMLARMGYHVIVIPNTWSGWVINAKPKFMPGDLDQEAAFTLHAIQAALKFIPKERQRGRIHLYGVSYGAFLASMVLKTVLNESLWDGVTLLEAPPYRLVDSLEAIDSMKAFANQHPECNSGIAKLQLFTAYHIAKSRADFSELIQECAPAVMANYSFFNSLKTLTERIGPKDYFDGTFSSYFDVYRGMCAEDVTSGKCERFDALEPKLRSLVKHGAHSIYVATADNDPINHSGEWDELAQKWTLNLVHIVPDGGHDGYWRTKDYQEWVKKTLGEN